MTEAELNHQRKLIARAKGLKIIMGLSILALIPASFYVVRFFQSKPVSPELTAQGARAQSQMAALAADTQAAQLAGKAALASPAVEEFAKYVRDSARVKPLMDWFYASAPGGYTPTVIARCADTKPLTLNGKKAMDIEAVTSDGKTMHVLMVEGGGQWRLDWETFAAVHDTRWKLFLAGKLPGPVELQIHAAKTPLGTLTEGYLTKEGVSRDSIGAAVRLWVADREGKFAFATLPQNSPMIEELLAGADWNETLRVTVEASLKSKEVDPPLVEMHRVVRKSWAIDESEE